MNLNNSHASVLAVCLARYSRWLCDSIVSLDDNINFVFFSVVVGVVTVVRIVSLVIWIVSYVFTLLPLSQLISANSKECLMSLAK